MNIHSTAGESLRRTLTRRGNSYDSAVTGFEALTGHPWHRPTPAPLGIGAAVSVVIPAFNAAYCLRAVLDSLAAQQVDQPFEVIVVDDASCDATATIARTHPAPTTVLRLTRRCGAAAARNVGTVAASGATIVYLDADIVLPAHVLADITARADGSLVLIGFRHNVPYGMHGQGVFPANGPDLYADHRARWRPPVGQQLLYSGITLHQHLDGRPLDHTRDLRDLGCARTYYDWDLPRMVVTALMAAPRAAIVDVGGFDPEFGAIGWGTEDTHLGAKLIATGLWVIPLRQAVGFHLDPPDADMQWRAKLATWPGTLRRYQMLLDQPAPTGRTAPFTTAMNTIRSLCEVLR